MAKALTYIFLILSTSLSAQKDNFGLIAGGNYGTLFGDFEEIIQTDRRLGLHAGLFWDFEIKDKIQISPQLIYSSQGFRDKGSESVFPTIEFGENGPVQGTTTISFEGAYVLEYLNLPLQVKYFLNDDFSLIVGPQLGVLLNAKFKGTSTVDGVTEDSDSKVDSDSKLDYGGLIGFFYRPAEMLFIELKYYQGFSNTNRNEEFINDDELGMRNSVFQLSLGYYLF